MVKGVLIFCIFSSAMRILSILFVIVFCLIVQNTYGNIDRNSVLIASEYYQLRTDDALYSTHKCWFYETNEYLTPEAVLSEDLPFVVFDKELHSTTQKKHQWLQFYVYNDLESTIHLNLGTGQINYVHTYIYKQQKLTAAYQHGFLENPKKFNNQRTHESKIAFPPHDTVLVLISINNYVPFHWQPRITLFNEENYTNDSSYWSPYFNTIESVFFFGAVFFAFCFVLGLYYYFRLKVYLYYLLYLSSLIVFGFSKIERVVNLLYLFKLPPELFYYMHEPSLLLMSGVYGFFLLQILDIRKDNYPELHRYILISSFTTLVSFVLLLGWIYFTHYAHHDVLMNAIIPVIQINSLITFICIFFVQSVYRNIVLIGSSCLLAAAMLTFVLDDILHLTLKLNGVVISYYILLKIGLLLEVIFFSIALGKRTYIIEEEKMSNYKKYIQQLELKNELSDKVNEFKNKALRAQINPHFLFNSLNAIDYLIGEDKLEKASAYIHQFSKLFRNVLDFSITETITLEQELETCKLYLSIEQERLNHKFEIKYKVDEQIDLHYIKLPSLLLQPFLENAIWHGIHNSNSSDLYIEIIIEEEENEHCTLKIYDNGIGRAAAIKIKQINKISHGMAITQERISIFNQTHNHKIELIIIDNPPEKQDKGTLIELKFTN